MNHDRSITRALRRSFLCLESRETPTKLREAMLHAVFPGGSRVRPNLLFSVIQAHQEPGEMSRPTPLASRAAAAIELLHCASLVHDDLACFDDAAVRRGQPSVAAAFGQPLAVLAGDALIVLAFKNLAAAPPTPLLADVTVRIARGVGAVGGMIAGQAWESETDIDLRAYHRAKTAALFEACVTCGAAIAGGEPAAWEHIGRLLGEAYQVADDLYDACGGVDGKPVGQDAVHGRPNAVTSTGIHSALTHFQSLVSRMHRTIPDVPGRLEFSHGLLTLCDRLVNTPLTRVADPRPRPALANQQPLCN
ncbi:MAG: polyprenyl synthetase family protein [Nannocystaceae bacterium]